MTTFRYTVRDAQGDDRSGTLDAESLAHAQQVLQQQGLSIIHLSEAPTRSQGSLPAKRLSNDETHEFTERVAQLASAGIPLAAGFHAAAAESTNPHVVAGMQSIAAELERGKPLQVAIEDANRFLPAHVAGLVNAASRTGNLGVALTELVELQTAVKRTKRRLWDGFAYPIVVGCMATLLLLVLLYWTGNVFERLFIEFNIQLPLITKILFWWRDVGIALMGIAVLVVFFAAIFFRQTRGEASWLRLINAFPLFGPLGHWLGLAEWSRLLSVLLKYRVPLPDALRLSGGGIGRKNVQEFSLALADGTARGQALSELLAQSTEFPRALIPIVRWGEKNGVLAQAFELGSQLFEQRVEKRALVLQSALPPLIFVAIGCGVLLVAGGLFFPLGMLIRGLSF